MGHWHACYDYNGGNSNGDTNNVGTSNEFDGGSNEYGGTNIVHDGTSSTYHTRKKD